MYEAEVEAAVAAVRVAATLTAAVQAGIAPDALQKQDKSPVTIADFGSQAVVCRALATALPGDPVVGEEASADLTGPAQASFRQAVVARVSTAIGARASEAEVLQWIDRGAAQPGSRFWTLDPIDGTKGFVRGEQYAIALALILDGEPVVAALGCPRLHVREGGEEGALFVAVKGQGAQVMPLFSDGPAAPVQVSARTDRATLRFVESYESGHSDHDWSSRLAGELGITAEPVRLDSQAKYATVARGQADIYLRLPTRKDYVEKIWDHAAGMLVVTEAGGVVTDIDGKPLDFARGRGLSDNRGVIACNPTIHAALLQALADLH